MKDDLFQVSDFSTRGRLFGWPCSIKEGSNLQAALQAATAIARHATLLIAASLNGNSIESDEWFEKAGEALDRISSDLQIGYALCEAHFQLSGDTFEHMDLFELFGHQAASWHQLVGKLCLCLAYNGFLGKTQDSTPQVALSSIDARLRIESTHARQRLAADSTAISSAAVPHSEHNAFFGVLGSRRSLQASSSIKRDSLSVCDNFG